MKPSLTPQELKICVMFNNIIRNLDTLDNLSIDDKFLFTEITEQIERLNRDPYNEYPDADEI
jgi:hypothetical protein